MNQYPKDWNQATEWLLKGELQLCLNEDEENDDSWKDKRSNESISPNLGLTCYRHKSQPVRAREVWIQYYSDGKTIYGACDNAETKTAILFREVLPMPDLTDEECTEIFSASAGKIHSFESYIRHVHNELKKMGRSQ